MDDPRIVKITPAWWHQARGGFIGEAVQRLADHAALSFKEIVVQVDGLVLVFNDEPDAATLATAKRIVNDPRHP
jgi:hypothetical protein